MNAVREDIKVVIGDVELWTRPFGEKKALVTATEGGTKLYLLRMHQKYPESFETFVGDEELCEEDLDGTFSVIVEPEKVNMIIEPGTGRFGFRLSVPDEEGADGQD